MRLAPALWLAAAALLAGCVSDAQKIAAISDVNTDFRVEYERILLEVGTRVYVRVPRDQAYAALQGAFSRIGMPVTDASPDIGYLAVRAPAPKPLDTREWNLVNDEDLPRIRQLAAPHIGALAARTVRFEPEGLDVIINATALEVRDGTEVSLTMRMRETAPPRTGYPRREYAPPTAVRMGLAKIWREVDRDLRGAAWRR
jgi:hypothetical protein